MTRRLVAWLVALPLVAAGTLLSHCYGLALVDPSTHAAAHRHPGNGLSTVAETVFGLPFLLVCVALLGFALAARTGQAYRTGPAAHLSSAWVFGLMPVAGFFLHQQFSSLVATGGIDVAALTAPAFLLGLLLQIPFGLVAYALAKTLLRFADRVGTALALRKARETGALRRARPALADRMPRLAPLALAAAPRAPPLAFRPS